MPGGQRYRQAGQNGGKHDEVTLFRSHLPQEALAAKHQGDHCQDQNVHDVRSQDVAQCQFRFANSDGGEIVGQFGQGGGQRHQDAAHEEPSPSGEGRQGVAVLGQLHSQEDYGDCTGQKYGY